MPDAARHLVPRLRRPPRAARLRPRRQHAMTIISGRALGDLLEASVHDLPASKAGLFRPYVWRAPRPAWMVAALAAAQAEHGEPVATCLCGGRITYPHTRHHGTCWGCGRRTTTAT